MITPKYIKGTSLYGYMNQIAASSGFSTKVLFSSRETPCRKISAKTYIAPMLTHSYYTCIAETISKNIPEEALSEISKSCKDISGPFDTTDSDTARFLISKELKYCPECIKRGEHYIYQQLRFTERCREHGIGLRTGCPFCGSPVPAEIAIENTKPFTCPTCKKQLATLFTKAPEFMYAIEEKAEEAEILYEETGNKSDAVRGLIFGVGDDTGFADTEDFNSFVRSYIENKPVREPDLVLPKLKKDVEKLKNPAEVLIPIADKYTAEKLDVEMSQMEIIEAACEAEIAKDPMMKGASIILRALYHQTPKRLHIKKAASSLADIKRSLKGKGIKHQNLIAREIYVIYLEKVVRLSARLFEESPYTSVFILSKDHELAVASFGVAIMEYEKEYRIYIFEKAEPLENTAS